MLFIVFPDILIKSTMLKYSIRMKINNLYYFGCTHAPHSILYRYIPYVPTKLVGKNFADKILFVYEIIIIFFLHNLKKL